jgi:hypothetical protein
MQTLLSFPSAQLIVEAGIMAEAGQIRPGRARELRPLRLLRGTRAAPVAGMGRLRRQLCKSLQKGRLKENEVSSN